MPIQDEHNNKTDQPLSSIDSDNTLEDATNPLKALLLGITEEGLNNENRTR